MTASNLAKGLEQQKRVVTALFLRELKTRFGETRLGYVWAFLEPVFHISVLLFIIAFLKHFTFTQVDPLLFLITGIVPFFLFRNTLIKTMNAVNGNRALMVFPQINLTDFVVARALLEFVIYITVGSILILAAMFFGIEVKIENTLGVLFGVLLIWLFGAAAGFILISVIAVVPLVEKAVQVIVRFLYLTSGVIFSIDKIPQQFQPYLLWNPILQIIEYLRSSFFIELTYNPEHVNFKYILIFIGLMILYGFILKNKFMRYILND